MSEDWESLLTPDEYEVLRNGGTEPPFTGEYTYHDEEGVYNCRACQAPLFSSDAKYDSGSGWPSFFQAVEENSIQLREDRSHDMERIEVICSSCKSHLGHLFPDGPEPTGLRYCINSICLTFNP